MAVAPQANRLQRVRGLLRDCERHYTTGDQEEDISSRENVVATYMTEPGQMKYTHMYFAKSVAAWRNLRATLRSPNDGPVVSIGAGPCTCLMGWFFDQRPAPGQVVRAFDVLEWGSIRALPSFQVLLDDVLGQGVDFAYTGGRYFPQPCPPQVSHLPNLTFLPPDEIPDGSTVLLPYVLNHLVGLASAVTNRAPLRGWLEEVRLRAKRVLVVDMRCDRAAGIWSTLSVLLGVAGTPSTTDAVGIRDFAPAYSPRAGWPVRRVSAHMRVDTVMLGDAGGWRFI